MRATRGGPGRATAEGVGANVRYVSPRTGAIRARSRRAALRTVAGWGEVARVDPAAQAITTRIRRQDDDQGGAGANAEASARAAAVVSEGDRARTPRTRRARDQVTGVGVKVCVLSDGVDSLAASQAAGELPAVDVLPDQAGDGDEGTAMLEILHDVAPGAELGFATAFISDATSPTTSARCASRPAAT